MHASAVLFDVSLARWTRLCVFQDPLLSLQIFLLVLGPKREHLARNGIVGSALAVKAEVVTARASDRCKL